MTKNFKNNILSDSLFSGAAAIALIAGVGIAAAPAQAGQLGWDNGTTNFFEDVNPDDPNDTFSVTFSPDSIALISNASSEFVPPFDAAPPPYAIDTLVSPITGNFELFADLGEIDGIREFEYALTNNLTFDFGNGVSVTYGDGSIFQGEFGEDPDGNIVNVSFEEILAVDTVVVTPDNTFAEDDPLFPVTGIDLEFADLEGGPGGEYDGLVSVATSTPEPTTILSLLAIGGLGLGLKRKQQSKQLSA